MRSSMDVAGKASAPTSRVCQRGILVALLIAILPFAAQARGKKSTTYEGAVDFGAQLLDLNDGCLSIDGTVTSGDFFKDLRRIDSGTEPEYVRGNSVVKDYPSVLTTSIRIVGGQCPLAGARATAAIFRGDSYTLTFGVEWKDGMELTPAALSPAVARCVPFRVMTDARSDSTYPAISCQLTVDGRGIPLNDHLIVSIFASDGTRVTRLSAAP